MGGGGGGGGGGGWYLRYFKSKQSRPNFSCIDICRFHTLTDFCPDIIHINSPTCEPVPVLPVQLADTETNNTVIILI